MSRRSVVLALALAVVLAAAGLFAAGLLLDGNGLSDGSDADDSDVGDTAPTGGEATEENPEGAGTDEAAPEPGDENTGEQRDGNGGAEQPPEENDPDDGESGAGEQEGADGTGGSDDADDPAEPVETADVPVEIYAADRGPIEDGEMRLYNTTSGAHVATHDFADGHRTVFGNLTRTTTFDIVVNVSYYPDETVTFNPRISEQVNETIGYEFRGAETYEMEWEVDELPTNVDYDDEDAERHAITQRGYSVFDGEGNYYSTWSPSMFDASYDYLHVAANNQSYMNAAVEDAEWKQIEAYWGDPGTSTERVTMEGLSAVEDRVFIEEKEVISTERNIVHVYRIPEEPFEVPMRVHIDPDSGYVVYAEIILEEVEDPRATRSIAEPYSHNEDLDAIPADFPISEINEEE